MNQDSTIAALATSPAPAGIAVVRVSGDKTASILHRIFRSKRELKEFPGSLIYGQMIDPQAKEVIDRGFAAYFPKPNSFTGEDVGEFHIHGSPLIAQQLLRVLYQAGAAPAQPGEFSKRAFINGKIDLVQAEAIGDIIEASNERALRIAQEHHVGRLSSAIEAISDPLKDVLAEVEAHLDFSDEDIDPSTVGEITGRVQDAIGGIGQLLQSFDYGHTVREGFRILLCGAPNVGKSSLLNRLLERERAIVTPISGTTRDLIEESMRIDGYQFVLCDSAGLTESSDEVERLGIELAWERVEWADLVLVVVDARSTIDPWPEWFDRLRESAKRLWIVPNKIDLVSREQPLTTELETCLPVAATTGAGIEALKARLVALVARSISEGGDDSVAITNERHRNCLQKAHESAERAQAVLRDGQELELVSADLRAALDSLAELIGQTYNDEILDRVFSRFCIGK